MTLPNRVKLAWLSGALFLATLACSLFERDDDGNGGVLCYEAVAPTDTPTPEILCYTPMPSATPTPEMTPTCYAPLPPEITPTAEPESRMAPDRDALRAHLLAEGHFPAAVARVLQ